MKLIDKVALIYIKDRKVLSTLSKGKDKYYFPGGKREGNESDFECLKRELKEEISVDLISAKEYGVFSAQAHGKDEGIIVQMTCLFGEFEGEMKADSEIEEIVWLTYDDKEKTSMVDQIIFDDLKSKGYIE